VKVANGSFTVLGAPSGDGYGGAFEYTNPAPLMASMPAERASLMFAVESSSLWIAFCVVVNIAVLALVLAKAW
jgi:hypothetical protein